MHVTHRKPSKIEEDVRVLIEACVHVTADDVVAHVHCKMFKSHIACCLTSLSLSLSLSLSSSPSPFPLL